RPCDSSLFSSSSSASSPRPMEKWKIIPSTSASGSGRRPSAVASATSPGGNTAGRRPTRKTRPSDGRAGRARSLTAARRTSLRSTRKTEREGYGSPSRTDRSIDIVPPFTPSPLSLIEIPLQDQTMAYSDVLSVRNTVFIDN
ncbi:hypothetical protein PENTCL1PPCAC_19127, partial [Pristionchus entomophagus]